MAEREYQKLAGARRRRNGFFTAFASRSSLWLGKDHLLCVDSTGYTEEYKRFYFGDIQTISLVGTKRRVIWNWVLVFPTVLCLAWFLSVWSASGSRELGLEITIAALTAFFALPLVVNNLFGPTCNCYLRTAVQTEQLPSLSRVRRARRVLNRIRPLITAAQGELAPGEIAERMREAVSSPAASPASSGESTADAVAEEPNAPPRVDS